MKIKEIANLLEAEICTGEDKLDSDVYLACGSDMMSDVLACVKEQSALLLTGLVNVQVINTCAMVDIQGVVFVRGKRPTQEIISLAEKNNMFVLATTMKMYGSCGKLYNAGLLGGD